MRYLNFGLAIAILCGGGVVCGQDATVKAKGQTQQPGQPNQPGQPSGASQQGTRQPGLPGTEQQPAGRNGQNNAHANSTSADQQIAAVICGCAHNEIEIAKLARSKATSPAVKLFAAKMVQDHSPGCEELRQIAGSLASHIGTVAATRSRTGDEPGSNDEAPRGQIKQGAMLDWVSIQQQVGQQCLVTLKQELGAKEGDEFDHCFMGQQIGAHLKAIDELKVLRNHASPDLRQKLEKELQMATVHLQQAKQIEEQLEDNPKVRISRKPE